MNNIFFNRKVYRIFLICLVVFALNTNKMFLLESRTERLLEDECVSINISASSSSLRIEDINKLKSTDNNHIIVNDGDKQYILKKNLKENNEKGVVEYQCITNLETENDSVIKLLVCSVNLSTYEYKINCWEKMTIPDLENDESSEKLVNKNTLIATSDNKIKWTSLSPVGRIITFAGKTPPKGYLLCNGASVSRTTYAKLFKVIGTTYGSGDGDDCFNLPDLVGENDYIKYGSPDDLNSKGGAKEHSFTIEEMPEHTHDFKQDSKTLDSVVDHSHGYCSSKGEAPKLSGESLSALSGSVTTSSAGEHTHSLSISGTIGDYGESALFNINPLHITFAPYICYE